MSKFEKILYLLNKKEKNFFSILLILMLVTALIDTLGVASVLPFIGLLLNPDLIYSNKSINFIYNFVSNFGITTTKDFLFLFGSCVFFLLIFSLIVRFFTSYRQIYFTLMLDYSISKRLLETYLEQPYHWFLNKNSSDLSKNILSEINLVINGTLVPIMTFFSQSFVILTLLIMLLIINLNITIIVSLTLISSYLFIYFFMKNILKNMGIKRFHANESKFKIVSEALGSIKDTKFLQLEEKYLFQYDDPAKIFAQNSALASVIGQVPRNFIEGIALGGMIVLILFLMLDGEEFIDVVPLLALYVFAGYKLIPSFQQVYQSLTTLRFYNSSLDNLYFDLKNLKKTKENSEKFIDFSPVRSIILENISYTYPNNEQIALKKISLSIKAKSKIGIIGKTGSGKTTLMDIILGLLIPNKGKIKINDIELNNHNLKSWQKKVGYVPQSIYLKDSTIAENIAFSEEVKNINYESVYNVAKIANIHDFIVTELDKGYQTLVGERGVRLSGGQKQRIGIARALYKNPEVIIFDEATNALDNATEESVIEAIDKLKDNITIIIVAHRLSTVKNCDQIFIFEKNNLLKSGKFNELNLL